MDLWLWKSEEVDKSSHKVTMNLYRNFKISHFRAQGIYRAQANSELKIVYPLDIGMEKEMATHSSMENPMDGGAWQATYHGVSKSRTGLSDFTFTFHLHALEKEMAPHSSVLAWRIPGTGEPGGLPLWGCTESDTTEAT